MRKFCYLLFFFFASVLSAQEFICEVSINAEQTGQPNLSVFKTLETALSEFINNTKWTQTTYKSEERIPCAIFINITSYDTNTSFQASIQVQASRPVFGSNYKTTIANFNDTDFNFEYLAFQPLVYNENGDQGNLVAVISYYLYTILGLEADTLEELGGTEFYKKAKQIVNIAQASGSAGWSPASGTQSRFRWNDDILSGIFNDFRKSLYTYHLKGLDIMSTDIKAGKESIINSLNELKKVNQSRPNSYVLRTFFDAKSTEISRILSGGPKLNISKTVDLLRSISPTYAKDWEAIKN